MLIHVTGVRQRSPDFTPADGFGIGVEQYCIGIEVMTLSRIVRSIHAKAVFDPFRIKPHDDNRIHRADTKSRWNANFSHRLCVSLFKEHQATTRGMMRVD